MFAEQCQLAIQYDKISAPEKGFSEAAQAFFANPEAIGCNVTSPFKGAAAALASHLNNAASLAQSVNTLHRVDDQTLNGYNTDGIGLVADLQNQGVALSDKTLLIIGAGGAARGVVHPLLDAGIKTLAITNRTIAKAHHIASQVEDSRVLALDKPGLMSFNADIIINSTSASLHNTLPDLEHISFADCELAYDMAYASKPTLFMQHASDAGAKKVADGLGMLVEQAAAAFTIWTSEVPQSKPVINSLRQQLSL